MIASISIKLFLFLALLSGLVVPNDASSVFQRPKAVVATSVFILILPSPGNSPFNRVGFANAESDSESDSDEDDDDDDEVSSDDDDDDDFEKEL